MRYLRVPAALLLVLVTTGGCLGWETRLVLQPDGSGTGSVTASQQPAALDALRTRVRSEAARLLGEPAPVPGERVAPGPVPLAPGWAHVDARGVVGFTLEKAETTPAVADGAPGLALGARFTALEAAARGGLFHGCEVALERRPKKRYLFTLRPPWAPSGPGADDAFGGVPEAALAPFAPDVAALRYRVVITFPVPVLATNGTLDEDRRTVRFEARGDDAPARRLEVELELSDDEPWPTFRHRPDLGALARRLAVPPPPVPQAVAPLDDATAAPAR